MGKYGRTTEEMALSIESPCYVDS